jgi:flagellar protein FliT
MTIVSQPLHWYAQLASNMTRMVELARAKQWEQLPGLDAQCTEIVDRLKALDTGGPVSSQDRLRIVALLTRVRADQEELSAQLQPQMTRLLRKIDDLQRQQDLQRAYGAPFRGRS